MPDYLYLLETRISPEQRNALELVQRLAQEETLNLYLTGGAVRDLICGAPIRDLDFTVEGHPARIVRALEKAGAELLEEDERLRHYELQFAESTSLSLACAREERFEYPGATPETRWSTIMDDLRRRDFSINAIGISLNAASRGLVLDPCNGLADLEKREVRALSMHSFTNRPIRLMRVLRYSARLGFPIESRTAEWFALALERRVQDRFAPAEVGRELLALGRDENPLAVIKEWSKHGLLGAIHSKLGKRPPSPDRLVRLLKIRDALAAQGYRVLLSTTVIAYFLARLSSRELANTLSRLKLRAAEINRITGLDDEAQAILKTLKGRKTKSPVDAYRFLEKVPLEMLIYLQNESSQAAVLGKIKNYLFKWKPLRQQLPVAELESLGVPRGPKFDSIIEQFFESQLAGRARKPQDRIPLLRKLAGIKPEKEKKHAKAALPKKPEKKAGHKPAKIVEAAHPADAEKVGPTRKADRKESPAPERAPSKEQRAPKVMPRSKPGARPVRKPAAPARSAKRPKPRAKKKRR